MNKRSTDPNGFDGRLSRLYTGSVDKQETYDQWARDYEKDLVEEMGYVGHIDAARVFSEVVPDRNCRVLDVACGTGLVGRELEQLGYQNIEGTDFSEGMLEKARATGRYRRLFTHDFTQDLQQSSDYDALICVGLFSFDLPAVEHMIHVIRAVKTDSRCVLTVNGAAWREMDYATGLQTQSGLHGFAVESVREAGYIENQGIDGRVLVIRSPSDPHG